jgi:hypothetical protein
MRRIACTANSSCRYGEKKKKLQELGEELRDKDARIVKLWRPVATLANK